MPKRRGNGEGCIYERKKGQWAAVVSNGTDPKTGKTKRKFLYGKTREEVRNKLRTVQNQQATGGIVDAGRLNLTTWLNTWCEAYAKPHIKPSTYNSYLQQIRCHIVPELGGILLKKLSTTDIQVFYAKLLESGNRAKIQDPDTGEMVERGGGLAPSTIVRIHNILNAALDQAVKENKITVNPVAATKPPRVEKKEMKILSQSDVGTFLQQSTGYRYYAAYVLALTSGMRRGEVLGLPWKDFTLDRVGNLHTKWSDIDKAIDWERFNSIEPWNTEAVAKILDDAKLCYKEPVLYIEQQLGLVESKAIISTPKTGTSIRYINIPVDTALTLIYQRYLQRLERKQVGKGYNKDSLIFCTKTGNPVPPRGFTRNFQGALKHAGLERLRFHDLRHTVATVLLEEGAALNTVQALLGHYDPKFTASQYGHVTARMRSEATEKLSNLFTAAKRKSTDGMENA